MSTRRQTSNNRYDHILPFIEDAANQYYGGNHDRGFRHWAFALIFGVGHDVQDTDVLECTAIDGADDFEIDGWFLPESDDDSVVNLFQSKRRQPGTTMGPSALAAFLNAPSRLVSAEEVAACHNDETKGLHDNLLNLLEGTRRKNIGCTVNLVWVTSGTISSAARRHAAENSSRTITVEVDGDPIDLNVTLECWDLQDLYQYHLTQQQSDDVTTKCDFEFQLEPGAYHQIVSGADYPTISMTVPVKQIIDVFGRHSYRIFRLNPRGPLGNPINRSIKRTLLDGTNRRRFHLLNNGITAICMSWRLDPGDRLVVQDFQIINGCQTTVTLWDARAAVRDEPLVMVTVKLAECPDHFANTIAGTTNTQAALKAEDFTSNEPVQLRLQSEFSAMNLPWFYQVKRGEWSKMLGGHQEKEKYRDPDGGYRKLTSKEVAQALVAFAGFPGEAKDKIRNFLNKDTLSSIAREDEFSYDRYYTDKLTAKQLLLPAMIQQKVWNRVARDKESEDWLEYARFHLIWLIGDVLRENYHLEGHHLFPSTRSESLTAQIADWFGPLYNVAVIAIRNAKEEAEDYPGHREFFRTPANYRLIESRRRGALQMARDIQDPTANLPT